MGESLGILTDFFFTYDVETYEQSNIIRSSEELEYFSRTYIQNSTVDYSKEYLLGVTIFLLISGSSRAVEIKWGIGVKYAGFIRPISVDEIIIGIESTKGGNYSVVIPVYQNFLLRAYNYTVSNIEYIFTNVTVHEYFMF